MRKVLVIGCSGSGKSTFSRKLREKTGLPLHHLDMIWHKPDKTTVTREEFDTALDAILESDEWIIDGNYSRTLERRFEKCDTVFLFDLPTEVCLEGVSSRIGKFRPDMPWIEEEFDPEFREWIIGFRENKMPHVRELIEKYKDKEVIVFHSRAEADAYLK